MSYAVKLLAGNKFVVILQLAWIFDQTWVIT